MSETLLDALASAAKTSKGITVLSEGGPERVPYADLARHGEACAAGIGALQTEGLPIILVLPMGVDFLRAFWGSLWAGLVPAPIPLPKPFSDLEEYAATLVRLSQKADGAPILTFPELAEGLRQTTAGRQLRLATLADVEGGSRRDARVGPLGLIQFTSGSLGDPKGVMLPHAALLANVRAVFQRLGGREGDVYVNWVPLVHDLGLIGGHLTSMVSQSDLVLLPTERFILEPSLWMQAMHEFRASFTQGPPFGYALAMRRAEPARYDLRAWRRACVGAEPVDIRLMRRFADTFAPSGYSPNALTSCYGMAEVSVGCAIPLADRPSSTVHVARGLEPGQQAQVVAPGEGMELVSVGRALDGHEIRISRGDGTFAGEREVGEIYNRGPSVFAGYWNDPEATARAREGEWLRTGDLGFFHEGELYIAGRKKDLIILRGRHYFPEEIEATVSDVSGVRNRGTLAFGEVDPAGGPERTTVVVESALDDAEHEALRRRVMEAVADRNELVVDQVVVIPTGGIPRTASGKLRRGEARKRWGLKTS